jgi:methionyl-tRNA formyltransferase
MTIDVVFFGTPEFAVPTLRKLLADPHINVRGVLTQPDRKRGRGDKLVPSPVKTIAVENGIPIWQPEKIKKDLATIEALKALKVDFFVVVAYGQILSKTILDLPKFGCINVHGSLLPAYRGAAPIQRCLVDGVTETGITTMLMDIGMDTGDMLRRRSLSVKIDDRAIDLAKQLAEIGADLLIETLYDFPNIVPQPQDDRLATYAGLIQKSEYQIDWQQSTIAIHNLIRGFSPNCYTIHQEKPLKIVSTIPLLAEYRQHFDDRYAAAFTAAASLPSPPTNPGKIASIVKNLGVIISTLDGYLLLDAVQLPNKPIQSSADLANSRQIII